MEFELRLVLDRIKSLQRDIRELESRLLEHTEIRAASVVEEIRKLDRGLCGKSRTGSR